MRRVGLLSASLAFLLATASGSTREATGPDARCADAETILAFADVLLVEPAGRPRFWRDHTGTDAAYLKIAYGTLDRDAAASLVGALAAREKPPERIEELRVAHLPTDDRIAEVEAVAAAAGVSGLPALGDSVLRALVVNDGGDWLFAELARWQAADPEGPAQSRIAARIARAVADLDDDALRALAERAGAAGLPSLAFALYSQQRILTDLVVAMERQPSIAFADGSDASGRGVADVLRQVATQSAFRDGFDLARQPAAVRAAVADRPFDDAYRPLAALVARVPQAGFLLPVFNATGEMRIGTVVAAGTLADIDAGALDPTDPDPVVARIVEGLDRVIGRELRESQLAAVRMDRPMGGDGGSAAEFVDRALARVALTSPLKDPALSPPTKPEALTAAIDWETWVRTARSIKDGTVIPLADRAIAADLLAASGRLSEAVALLADTGDGAAAEVAYRHMVRLDDACAGHLDHPWAMNPPVYRFPAR
jgi:hypothetical protein